MEMRFGVSESPETLGSVSSIGQRTRSIPASRTPASSSLSPIAATGPSSHATNWATVSDTGGKAEVLGNSFVGPTDCTSYSGPFCIYPSYTQGSSGVHYGVDFPDETNDLGGVDQVAQTQQCGGPFGPDSTYCDTPVPIVLP